MRAWAAFAADLRRDAADEDVAVGLARAYTHAGSAVRYLRVDTCLGCGRYGRIYAYLAQAPVAGAVPEAFALKAICFDAWAEVAAIAAIHKMDRVPAGVAYASVLRFTTAGSAEICMPLYEGSLQDLVRNPPTHMAVPVCLRVSRIVLAVWDAGLAYCDLKLPNILFKTSSSGGTAIALGDMGSIVPRAERNAEGIFTYPPRRSADGVVKRPREMDLVWSLGVLLMCMCLGDRWVTYHLSSQGLRKLAAAKGTLQEAVAIAEEAVIAAAEGLRLTDGASGAAAADAIIVAVAAWRGDKTAGTFEAFMCALDKEPPDAQRATVEPGS